MRKKTNRQCQRAYTRKGWNAKIQRQPSVSDRSGQTNTWKLLCVASLKYAIFMNKPHNNWSVQSPSRVTFFPADLRLPYVNKHRLKPRLNVMVKFKARLLFISQLKMFSSRDYFQWTLTTNPTIHHLNEMTYKQFPDFLSNLFTHYRFMQIFHDFRARWIFRFYSFEKKRHD